MLYAMMRILGALLGLSFIVTGPLVVVGTRSLRPQDILVLLSFLLIGVTFIRYGITGRHERIRVAPKIVIPLLLLAGALFVAASLDRLFFDSRGGGAFSLIVAAIYGLIGAVLLSQVVVLLRIRRRRE